MKQSLSQFSLVFYREVSLSVSLAFLFTCDVVGESFFPVGSSSEFLGIGDSSEGSAIEAGLYNPALLLQQTPETQVRTELGWISVRQSYEHPDFDPVHISLKTLFGAFAVSGHHSRSEARWMFGLIPTGNGTLNIRGLPRRVVGEFKAIKAEFKTQSYDLSFALAKQLPNSDLDVGLRILMRHEQSKIAAYTLSNGSEFAQLEAKNNFWMPSLGIVWKKEDFKLGVSYEWPKIKKYKGKESTLLTEGSHAPSVVNYEPAILRVGATYFLTDSPLKLKFQSQHSFYESGSNIVRESLSSTAKKADLNNTTDFSAAIFYSGSPTSIGVSLGTIAAAWGEGEYDAETPEASTIGRDFGKPRSTPQTHFGLLSSTKIREVDVLFAIGYAVGKAESSENAHSPGYFQSELLTASASFSYFF